MTDTRNMQTTGRFDASYVNPVERQSSGWVGLMVFAGALFLMLGAFHAIMGLVAVFDPGYYLVTGGGLAVTLDYTVWGWVHLVFGALAFATGIGVLSGRTWARVVGICVAVLSAAVNLAFLAAYPLWSVIVIALDVLTVYALATHGREMRNPYR
ncbi:DUF7144 family membrane protein [Pilimelia terevasa]|nr:hypothetical protein [Pilimelia terevasa]